MPRTQSVLANPITAHKKPPKLSPMALEEEVVTPVTGRPCESCTHEPRQPVIPFTHARRETQQAKPRRWHLFRKNFRFGRPQGRRAASVHVSPLSRDAFWDSSESAACETGGEEDEMHRLSTGSLPRALEADPHPGVRIDVDVAGDDAAGHGAERESVTTSFRPCDEVPTWSAQVRASSMHALVSGTTVITQHADVSSHCLDGAASAPQVKSPSLCSPLPCFTRGDRISSTSSVEQFVAHVRESFAYRESSEYQKYRAGYKIFVDEVEKGWFLCEGEVLESSRV